jgi:hypothetical protein
MPARIAHRMDRFRCQEQTTAIAEPSPIPDCVTVWVVWVRISANSMVSPFSFNQAESCHWSPCRNVKPAYSMCNTRRCLLLVERLDACSSKGRMIRASPDLTRHVYASSRVRNSWICCGEIRPNRCEPGSTLRAPLDSSASSRFMRTVNI